MRKVFIYFIVLAFTTLLQVELKKDQTPYIYIYIAPTKTRINAKISTILNCSRGIVTNGVVFTQSVPNMKLCTYNICSFSPHQTL